MHIKCRPRPATGGFTVLPSLPAAHRWMSSWNISLSTEGKVRSMARDLIGPNLASELVPFTFSLDGGGEEIRKAPMAYIPDLQAKIKQLLDQNDR